MSLRGKKWEAEVEEEEEEEECTGGRVRGRENKQLEVWWLERRMMQKMFRRMHQFVDTECGVHVALLLKISFGRGNK